MAAGSLPLPCFTLTSERYTDMLVYMRRLQVYSTHGQAHGLIVAAQALHGICPTIVSKLDSKQTNNLLKNLLTSNLGSN
jgi:hypothetical protein